MWGATWGGQRHAVLYVRGLNRYMSSWGGKSMGGARAVGGPCGGQRHAALIVRGLNRHVMGIRSGSLGGGVWGAPQV